ncbi:phosphomethylpyrimidine synthase ThiC [Carboxydocella sp. JDF658]|uniref:phosphomethylpyrimidine synthase ThiC n=1 Tax=Carboxydocella sp. JDF658 TaxID=1926600 RepID=UPI0009AC746E|nr:phosphomethylpyrimidine synthase ThiC [Carboxydocella sp. JDF658]GAW30331.1 phosphomethylpyrimidine synthase [Carboxydocella sp. JDF658]
MTQLELARAGRITAEMKLAAEAEGIASEIVRERIAAGVMILPANKQRDLAQPKLIGYGATTKVNANIGTSGDWPEVEKELEKLEVALAAGADAIMDLSLGPNLRRARQEILKRCPVPVGTVPIYEAGFYGELSKDKLFQVIEDHCRQGVDFITVHCGINRRVLEEIQESPRVCGIVSRGGSFIVRWMQETGEENPLYAHFDELLELVREYDVTLSLGDGLRPGAVADATDGPQIAELLELGRLVKRAWAKGVQVMVEGPGHVPLNQIETNIKLQKRLCHGAPFYVLGPLVTDVGAGHDHITAAIGGAIAAAAGADFLCYVTPAEHLGLPDADDVRQGVIATRIAAHAADLAKGIEKAWNWDKAMSKARKELDWEQQLNLALDQATAREMRKRKNPGHRAECSMCGEFCAMKQCQ